MTTHRPVRFRSLAMPLALAGLVVLLAGAPAQAQPGLACTQTLTKALATCTKKAAVLHVSCYKKTGAACASADAKLQKTYDGLTKKLLSKCASPAEIDAAGYGPFTVGPLVRHFKTTCESHGNALVRRAYGNDADRFADADSGGKKCLGAAAKEAGGLLSKSLLVLSKCVASGCPDANADIAALATASAAKIDKKCADLAGLTGLSSAVFAGAATSQVPSALASPCDPLDTSRCMFPFPNDHFTLPDGSTPSGRRLNLGEDSMPSTATSQRIDTGPWNEADGFSIGAMLLMNDVNIDLVETGAAPITDLAESLDPNTPIVLFDAETGEQQLLWIERDLQGSTLPDRPIIGRVGKNLKNGHRYIVAMRGIKDSGGNTLAASAAFAAYRDATPTTVLPFELRRSHMEDIFDTLGGFGVNRNDLYLAWDFTTQSNESTAGKLLAMRDDAVDTILGADAPEFTVATVLDTPDAGIFRRVEGTFEVPLYLSGTGAPGSSLTTDVYGKPVNSGGIFTASFRCIIPESATTGGSVPAIPARISLYGHGLLGSHTEVNAGNVRAFSNEHNIVFCATDWTGFSNADVDFAIATVSNFTNFPTFIDRQHQGILNAIFLGRLMLHADGFASHSAFEVGGESMLDTSDLFYDGNSQGGILGGVLAAFAQDVERFVLGVPGINYSTLLHRSIDFAAFDFVFVPAYPSATDRNLILSAGQVIWDRTDPNGHVNNVTSNPYDGTPAKKILYQVAFGDHQVAPVTAEIAARTIGAHIHTPTLGKAVPEVTPYFDIPPIPAYPFDGSALVIWDSGNPAPPLGNVPPPAITMAGNPAAWALLEACAANNSVGDPHSCPRSDPDARVQKSEFLKTNGAVVDVCGGAPCIAQ